MRARDAGLLLALSTSSEGPPLEAILSHHDAMLAATGRQVSLRKTSPKPEYVRARNMSEVSGRILDSQAAGGGEGDPNTPALTLLLLVVVLAAASAATAGEEEFEGHIDAVALTRGCC